MNLQVQKMLIGGAGLAASKVAEQVALINPEVITEGAGLLVQILIGIVTLFGLFKKKKPL